MVHGSATVSSEILSATHVRDPLRDARLPLLRPTFLPTPSMPPSSDPPQDASAPAAPLPSSPRQTPPSPPPTLLPTPSTPPSSDPPQQRTEGAVHLDPHLHHAPARTVSQAPLKSRPHRAPNLSMHPTASPAMTATSTSSPRLTRPPSIHRVCPPFLPARFQQSRCTTPSKHDASLSVMVRRAYTCGDGGRR